MENIAWSALHLLVLGSLVYLFCHAAQLLWVHAGRGAALFFGLALLLLGSRSTSAVLPAGRHNLLAGIPANAPLGNANSTSTIAISPGTRLILLAEYHSRNGYATPRGLFLLPAGLFLGHTYEPLTGHLTQQGQRLHYQTVAIHRWQLVGVTVFQTTEQYAGWLPLNTPLH